MNSLRLATCWRVYSQSGAAQVVLALMLWLLSGWMQQAAACDLCSGFTCAACSIGTDEEEPPAAYGAPRNGWPQAYYGAPVYLTYSYQNLLDGGLKDPAGNSVPVEQIRTAIEEAFSVWAAVAPLHFIEVEDDGLPYSGNNAGRQFGQIRLRHVYINGPDPLVGSPTTKAQAYYPGTAPNAGDVEFDHGDPWSLIGTVREPDILGAAIHELGHSLGLTHSDLEAANMYWIFKRHTGPGSGMLHPDDIAAIQSIYGAGVGSVTPLPWGRVPEPSTLLLALGLIPFAHRAVRVWGKGSDAR